MKTKTPCADALNFIMKSVSRETPCICTYCKGFGITFCLEWKETSGEINVFTEFDRVTVTIEDFDENFTKSVQLALDSIAGEGVFITLDNLTYTAKYEQLFNTKKREGINEA